MTLRNLTTMVSARSKQGTRFEALGATLRQTREKKHLSLNAVSQALTVPEHYLRALEDGDVTVFPAEVYAWGSYQKYAQYLGLSDHKDRQAFLRALSHSREVVPLKVHRPRSWMSHMLTGHLFIMMGVAFIAVLIGTYVIWQVQSFLQVPSIEILEPKVAVVDHDKIILHGRVDDEAQLTINDEKILLNDDGTFTNTLYLHPGVNPVRLEATNAAGRTHLVERNLLFPRVER